VPTELSAIENVEIASRSQAAAGVIAGDFLDVIRLTDHRVALVLGDAAGHGVTASIPAFQAKYVLRTVVHQYRDPAQALEVLNAHISNLASDEALMSLFLAVIDTRQNTLRYASAGHCTCWATSGGEPIALRSTGPLLLMDAAAEYASREIPFTPGQIALLYSDGVIEAKRGSTRLGEDKVVGLLRREHNSPIDVLCKAVLNSASHYSDGTNPDDITVLGVRRT
jgi:serine phosphatase RsbU (regulator of sigma subunit)